VGLQRRRREEVYRMVQQAQGPWLECPVGVSAGERKDVPKTWVQEVAGDEAGVRVFVVHSEERLAYERGMREAAMAKARVELEKLRERVRAGKLKAPEKIGAAAARILSRHHGQRYYGWKLEGGELAYFESPNLEREKAYEGKYLIQTEEQGLSPVDAVTAYKELSEVERAFRHLKDVIELRPIYHPSQVKDQRVRGHIFVAALAFLLERALEKKLKAAGSGLSAEAALEALKTIHVVELEVGSRRKRGVTSGRQRARRVLAAMGINQPEPPPALDPA